MKQVGVNQVWKSSNYLQVFAISMKFFWEVLRRWLGFQMKRRTLECEVSPRRSKICMRSKMRINFLCRRSKKDFSHFPWAGNKFFLKMGLFVQKHLYKELKIEKKMSFNELPSMSTVSAMWDDLVELRCAVGKTENWKQVEVLFLERLILKIVASVMEFNWDNIFMTSCGKLVGSIVEEIRIAARGVATYIVGISRVTRASVTRKVASMR